MTDSINQKYHEVKGWSEEAFGRLAVHHAAYFSAELKRSGLTGISRVVEIGFGNGSFLQYCAQAGMPCLGVELDAHQVRVARARGFDAVTDSNLDAAAAGRSPADLVVLFDVLEHIPREALVTALGRYQSLLRPGGCILARVPNGDSPFGLLNQHGDLTHCTTIGSEMIPQLARLTGMELVFVGGEARPILCGSFKWMIHRLLQWPFRLAADLLVKWSFYPGARASFTSPNMTFVLRRKPTGAAPGHS